MIVVKRVEVETFDKDPIVVNHFPVPDPPVSALGNGKIKPLDVRQEVIKGKAFRNAEGEEVIIGMSNEAQELLGIPFQAFEDMRLWLEQTRRDLEGCLQDHIKYKQKVRQAGFWERLKYLFTGKI